MIFWQSNFEKISFIMASIRTSIDFDCSSGSEGDRSSICLLIPRYLPTYMKVMFPANQIPQELLPGCSRQIQIHFPLDHTKFKHAQHDNNNDLL